MSTTVSAGLPEEFGPRLNAVWAIGRYLFALIGLALFAYASAIVSRSGLSSLLAQNSVDNSSLASANAAIRLNGLNPGAYLARASLYRESGQTTEAIRDLERAVDLRPNDYFLWLELGFLRYQNDEMEGAIAGFRQSARLAPFYAQPRWYLGNVLLQTGKTDDGFAEIRRAIASDPLYLPEAIELANDVFEGDVSALVQALQPQNSTTRLALAQYLIKGNRVSAAMQLFRETREGWSPVDAATLISELLTARKPAEAHEIWLSYHPPGNGIRDSIPLLEDGSFENEINEGLGFGWRLSRNLQRISAIRDTDRPASGTYCLRLDFGGASQPETPMVSQIVMTEPSTRYELSLAYRTRSLITGGPPVVTIVDVSDGQSLAQSKTLPRDSPEWNHDSVEFLTHASTVAVQVIIQRTKCSSSPCPAFGYAWFDNFVLGKP